ncbi:MAG TPA: glutamate-1-semialdehyde 2,1-aminomutase [Planctomycetota bacterium]|nr:glutamate-1-semialdehyde 2,1-aminomutase [Planctomycetota bacterium]HRR79639.1 glutamate-1-semialdehyde 2,1-aminomutase [Planctomycetota bacterium]HRT95104.1 glutamate-1-semialdehyde 2,1-aminomutase [Planctomycetota bacterium]
MGERQEHAKSAAAFEAARKLIPGGVNSPVRAFGGVGGTPVFMASGQGCRLTDIDGNAYVDYVASWGPLILGHAAPEVVAAVKAAAEKGSSFGAPTLAETRLAELLVEAVPSIEKVRLVNSGTEATMSAIRLARAFTRRDAIVKFDGCYHGHADGLLVAAGSGALTFGIPTSPGVPADFARHTLVLPYNDLDAVKALCDARGKEIAAIIIEPIAANVGLIPPKPGYLAGLREVTRKRGILLIFDEVITGFRAAWGGAQALYGVTPDLTTLGKIIGGGLPVGAYGGRADIMDHVAPVGATYQAGTLSGNPIAVAAGLATLERLRDGAVYQRINALCERLCRGMAEAAAKAGLTTHGVGVQSMFCTFFCPGPVWSYADAKRADVRRYAAFFHGMLDRGFYFAPSQFETGFVSAAHTEADIDATIAAAQEVLGVIAKA